jgi:predicted nucleotidyltransferase
MKTAHQEAVQMVETESRVIKIIRDYLREVDRMYPVDKAILFGSHAKGSARKHSDIDLAIFSRSITAQNRLDALTKIIFLTHRFQKDIQPIIFSYEDYLDTDNDFIAHEVKGKGLEVI